MKLVASFIILSLIFNSAYAGSSLTDKVTSDGEYLLKFNAVNDRIVEMRNKLRKTVYPNCKYDNKIEIPPQLVSPAAQANAPIRDSLVSALFPAYSNLEYVSANYLKNEDTKYISHNILTHIFSTTLDMAYACDYPVGEITKDKKSRDAGKMPIQYNDAKYGSKTLEIPFFMSRQNNAAYFTDQANGYAKEQVMYSGLDFLGKQYYQIYPTKNPNSLLLSVCSVHPGTKIWGNSVSSSFYAYYKSHRVRHDDEVTAWFTITPGEISFDGVRVCTLSKLTLNSDGSKNIEVLAITPKFKGLKWVGFSAVINKIKTESWLGNLGGVAGFIVGLFTGNPIGGWSIGQALGVVANKTVVLDYVNDKVKEAIEQKSAEYLNGRTLDQFADSKAQEAISKSGFVGNILRSAILTPVLEQTIAIGKVAGGDIVISPSDQVVARCEAIVQEKINKNSALPDTVKNGLPAMCRHLGKSFGVKVFPFNKVRGHQEAGCYNTHINFKEKTNCALQAKAKLIYDKKFEDEIRPIFNTLVNEATFNVKSMYKNISPKINSLVAKYRDQEIAIDAPSIALSCKSYRTALIGRFSGKNEYSKCIESYNNDIKPQLDKLGYKSRLDQTSKNTGMVIITNPFKELKGELK